MSSQTSTIIKRKECADGSITYYHPEVDECYHSPVGATLEAKEKYVGGIHWESFNNKEKITILDICFGMGYNTAAAIDFIKEKYPDKHIEVIALENDMNIVRKGLVELNDFTCAPLLVKLLDNTMVQEENISVTLIIKDARKSIKSIQQVIDVVFFDPFSPKKAPHMWEVNFMKDIFNVCALGAQLITYSCARKIRENFAQAGFTVQNGPVVGRRGPATLCTKDS